MIIVEYLTRKIMNTEFDNGHSEEIVRELRQNDGLLHGNLNLDILNRDINMNKVV